MCFFLQFIQGLGCGSCNEQLHAKHDKMPSMLVATLCAHGKHLESRHVSMDA